MNSFQKIKFFSILLFFTSVPLSMAENWKEPHIDYNGSFGILTGLGIVDGAGGFAIQGQGSFVLLKEGFFKDITNEAHLELSVGPLLGLTGMTPIQYNIHLRWDFIFNDKWTFFATGGLGGAIMTGSFELFLRFGMGAFYRATHYLWIRGEASHEQIMFGVTIPF